MLLTATTGAANANSQRHQPGHDDGPSLPAAIFHDQQNVFFRPKADEADVGYGCGLYDRFNWPTVHGGPKCPSAFASTIKPCKSGINAAVDTCGAFQLRSSY